MNTNEFDKLIREKLSDYQSQVDTDEVWAGVQAKMDSDRTRGGAYWWFSGLLILAAVVGAGWYAFSERETAMPLNTYTPRSMQDEPVLAEAEDAETDFNQIPSERSNYQTDNTRENPPQPEQVSPDSETKNASPARSAIMDSSNKDFASVALEADEIKKSPVSGERSLDEGERLPNEPAITFTENVGMADKGPGMQTEITSGDLDLSMDLISTIPASQILRNTTPEIIENPERNDFYPNKNRKPTLTLLADGGIGAISKQIEPGAPRWHSFTEERLRTESPLEFASAQLRLMLEFPGDWYVTSGVSFTQVNERFSLNRTIREEEIVTYVSEIHVDEAGDSTLVYSSGLVSTEHHQDIKHMNRYTFIDIPVTAGYNRHFGRWSVGIEGGIMLNLSLRSTGSMLDSEGVVVRIENTDMFHSRLGLSYTAGARFGYQLTTRTSLYIQPGLRHIPGSVTEKGIQRQTYTLYGINAGVAYRLGE